MAKIDGNVILESITGMLGKQIVIKKRNGKPYMSVVPVRDENKPFTPNQLAHQQKFREKMQIAKKLSTDPHTRKIYLAAANGGRSPLNVALADAFSPPKVEEVIIDGYLGHKDSIIFISAKDDVLVTAVEVEIFVDNVLLEKGPATPSSDKAAWVYKATQENVHMSKSKIIVKAYDLPGNETKKEIILKDARATP